MAEDRRHHEQPTTSVRRGKMRKLEDEFLVRPRFSSSEDVSQHDLLSKIRELVEVLESTSSSIEADRAILKRSIHILSKLAKNDDIVNSIVESGAVPVLVRHLQSPQSEEEAVTGWRPCELEVVNGSAYTLALLAMKPDLQQLIVDAGALPHLVALLKRHKDGQSSRAVNGAIRLAADAIKNLAFENSSIKISVRVEGGIPLVELLETTDAEVQRAAAGALCTLALKNDENKDQIVECNALPTLVLMLQSEDPDIHFLATGVVGSLVHKSPYIKKEVLLAGALQPVIELLSSTCSETQKVAALLLAQFAAADTDCKVHIVKRGAVGPLIEMLQSPEDRVKEMSAFALGRLAQDTNNQAAIARSGGIVPLLKLLESRNGALQHNAAFALYSLSDNEGNVAELISLGGVQKLLDCEFIVRPSRVLVRKTEKIEGEDSRKGFGSLMMRNYFVEIR